MSGILILFLIGLIGTAGIFYIMKIPRTPFNIVAGLIAVVACGTHMFIIFLAILGLLYLKENINKKLNNGKQ